MKLILDTLEAARLTASPSDALGLADAIADLSDLADVLAALGMTLEDVLPALDRYSWPLDDVPAALDDFKALREHVRAQPFETTAMDDGTTVVDDLTPGAFPEWLATLERLAQ